MAVRNDEADAEATSTPRAPVTSERPVPTNLSCDRPYMARALKAVDAEHPTGTTDYDHQGYTVLQQHVKFFDRNGDGIIYPWETYAGFRALGFSHFISFSAIFLVNGALSYSTLPGWLPNPLLPIYIDRIHRGKHGSDSGVYDNEGRFVPSKFEEIWTKYSKSRPNKMNREELTSMQEGLRVLNDPFGRGGQRLEWNFAYTLAKDEEGYMSKEAVRGIYDGSYFYQVEKQRANRSATSSAKSTSRKRAD